MNRERIEELVDALSNDLMNMGSVIEERDERAIRADLQQCAKECFEEAADTSEQMALYTGVDCAAAIRALAEEVWK